MRISTTQVKPLQPELDELYPLLGTYTVEEPLEEPEYDEPEYDEPEDELDEDRDDP